MFRSLTAMCVTLIFVFSFGICGGQDDKGKDAKTKKKSFIEKHAPKQFKEIGSLIFVDAKFLNVELIDGEKEAIRAADSLNLLEKVIRNADEGIHGEKGKNKEYKEASEKLLKTALSHLSLQIALMKSRGNSHALNAKLAYHLEWSQEKGEWIVREVELFKA